MLDRPKVVLFAVVLFLACGANSVIRYEVAPSAESNLLHVRMTLSTKGDALDLQMPNWAPGSYRLVDNYRNVQSFSAKGANGAALATEKPDNNTWRVRTSGQSSVVVSYSIPNSYTAGAMHYSGPSTYLYVVGRISEECRLRVAVPEGWRVAVGLDEVADAPNEFRADDYDVLADNPVTLGDFLLDEYRSYGKPHFILLRGATRADVDRPRLINICKSITDTQGAFFGGLPYNKYVWHFNVTDSVDGGGGLEHLSSTQITLASGLGPRVVSVISHEFFHLWNVKRIRSKPLGPFDYLKLPRTGALWWLEGVTDYYADVLLVRSGLWDANQLHDALISNLTSVRARRERLEVSPYESSWRVSEAANGRGNSQGFGVSYYNTGWIVGFCLDAELRSVTGGKHTLDDVTRALWELCKDSKPGFEEDEIRKQLVRFGGERLGAYYDQIVMKPGDIDVESQLAKLGLAIEQKEEPFADVGFDWSADKEAKGARVRRIRVEAAVGGLQEGDIIVSVDGTRLPSDTNKNIATALSQTFSKAGVGVSMKLLVVRGGGEVEVTVIPFFATRTVTKIVESQNCTQEQRALRRAWYRPGL